VDNKEITEMICVSTEIETHILVASRLGGPDAQFVKDRLRDALVEKLSREVANIVLSTPDKYVRVKHNELNDKSTVELRLSIGGVAPI